MSEYFRFLVVDFESGGVGGGMAMQKFNYHTHTFRCNHAIGTEEEMVQAAIEAGFETLGFSEHMPFDDWEPMNIRIPFEDMDDYLSTCFALKEKYKNQINIRVGLETEYFADRLDYLKEVRQRCDYFLLGQHSYDRGVKEYCDAPYDNEEWILKMADQVCEAIQSGLFRYLAHPDYFMLHGCDLKEGHKQAIKKMARCAKEHDVVVEINVKGPLRGRQVYQGRECWRYPNYLLFQIIAEAGCRVCFGWDAHSPAMLKDRSFELAIQEEFKDLPLQFEKDLKL